jgi:hypothetical protein
VTQGGSEGVFLIHHAQADVIHSESVSISGHLPDTNSSTACCISTVHHNWNLLAAAWKRGNPESHRPASVCRKTTGKPDLMCLAQSGSRNLNAVAHPWRPRILLLSTSCYPQIRRRFDTLLFASASSSQIRTYQTTYQSHLSPESRRRGERWTPRPDRHITERKSRHPPHDETDSPTARPPARALSCASSACRFVFWRRHCARGQNRTPLSRLPSTSVPSCGAGCDVMP